MKSTLFIFAVLFGAALADEGKSIQAAEEGRLFAGIPTIMSLIQLGAQIIILLALINFVTSLKGSIDFDALFGKGGDEYYDTGYAESGYDYAAAPVAIGGSGSSYSSYSRQSGAQQRSSELTNQVHKAIDNFTA